MVGYQRVIILRAGPGAARQAEQAGERPRAGGQMASWAPDDIAGRVAAVASPLSSAMPEHIACGGALRNASSHIAKLAPPKKRSPTSRPAAGPRARSSKDRQQDTFGERRLRTDLASPPTAPAANGPVSLSPRLAGSRRTNHRARCSRNGRSGRRLKRRQTRSWLRPFVNISASAAHACPSGLLSAGTPCEKWTGSPAFAA